MIPNWKSGKPIIMAHRGGGGEAPENSLQAFEQAAKLGFRYLETDVHMAVDGKLYLHHGSLALRPERPLTLEKSYTSLAMLFKAFPDHCISIDAKQELVVKPLAKIIVQYGMAEKVCLVSVDDSRAGRAADLVEKLSGIRPTTALSSVKSTLDILFSGKALLADRKATQARLIYVHRSLINSRTISRAHRQNLKIIAWTVNDAAMMGRLLAAGVDGFMTDVPSLAQEFIV